MKNKRIMVNGRTGTVIDNIYRVYDSGKVDRYYDVLFDDTGNIEPVSVKAEIELFKVQETEINKGDYVKLIDKFMETHLGLNRNFIYKVEYTKSDFFEKFIKLCGVKDRLFRADSFEKVEVK